MKNTILFDHIIIDPAIMTGKPVVKGTRLTVQFILGLFAQGMTLDEVLSEYKNLTKEDVFACFSFAREALDTTIFAPLSINK